MPVYTRHQYIQVTGTGYVLPAFSCFGIGHHLAEAYQIPGFRLPMGPTWLIPHSLSNRPGSATLLTTDTSTRVTRRVSRYDGVPKWLIEKSWVSRCTSWEAPPQQQYISRTDMRVSARASTTADFSFCSSKDRKHFRSNTEKESGGLRNNWLTIPCNTALHMVAMTCQCAIQ